MKVADMSENLLSDDEWRGEAEAVIKDVEAHVQLIEVAGSLGSSNQVIYFNITTVEGTMLCVKLSASGFQVVGNTHNDTCGPPSQCYDTPYALLNEVSPEYKTVFANALIKKLEATAREASDEDEGDR